MAISTPQCDEHIRSEHWYAHREKGVPTSKQQRAYCQRKKPFVPLKPAENYLEKRRAKRVVEAVLSELAAAREAAQGAIHEIAADDLEQRFREQADKWQRETQHLSSPTQRMMHPSYQAILGMGQHNARKVVALMIRDMQQNQRAWFWALSYLAQDNPISQSDAGKTDKMIKAWVNWGKVEGLL
jgi:hypothetical protein